MTKHPQFHPMLDTQGFNAVKDAPSRTQTVRLRQMEQGHEPCFGTEKRFDCAEICEWRRDCHKRVAVWLR